MTIPAGWKLTLEGDTCLVDGGMQGAYVAHEHARDNIASVVLFRLAKAMLAAPAAPAQPEAPDWYSRVPKAHRYTLDICTERLVQDDDGPWVLRSFVDSAIKESGSSPAQSVERLMGIRLAPGDVFRWMGDLAAFEAWHGSRCPIDFGWQISVPTGAPGRYLRVWCGSWIVRHNGTCYTFTDEAFDKFIRPHVRGAEGHEGGTEK